MHSKFIALLLLLPLLGACRKNQPAAAAAPPPVPVTVVTLQSESVTLTRELPGRTKPFLVAEIRPQITGIVRKRLFTEGGKVEAGQVLYQIDDATYQADFNSAKAALVRAESARELARINARRTAGLAKIDAVSRQDDENAAAALVQAEADVGVARAALASREVMLGYTKITSPISGRIGISSVTQGALVTANQAAPLATVQQLDPMYVDLSVSSSELLQIRAELAAGTIQHRDDAPVTITLEDGVKYAHPGKVAFADLSVDPTTGSFALRVAAPNPDGILQPGMYVRATLAGVVRPGAILAPQRGISRDPKGNATAMIVGPDGKAEQRTVVASRTIGDQWLIDRGLVAGDRLIVAGLQKIRPGAAVQATEAAATPAAAPAPATP